MNLITDPWIPVVFENGKSRPVSLERLYSEAESIRDLNANPPQRIALMRLLLCITQAALDGPEDEDDWQTCRDRIIPASLDYLATRHDKFNLYGKQPFLQIAELLVEKYSTLDKLLETMIGENPMFLGQRVQDGRVVTHSEKLLALLVFLNFSAGGRVGQSIWCGTKYSDSTFATPCFNRLFLFLRGNAFLETLWLNLIPLQKAGQPVWDQMPANPNDSAAFTNAYETHLGRMVPLTRLILLPKENAVADCIIGPVPKEHVFSNEPILSPREPYCTLKLSKANKHYYMSVDPSKHIWRELGSLLALQKANENFSAMNLPNAIFAGRSVIDIWCGGLAKGATAAKIYDMVDWNFSIPANLLEENELNKYINGVDLAQSGETGLKKTVGEYIKKLGAVGTGYTRMAVMLYWAALDSSYQLLLTIASDLDRDLDDWRKLLYSAMHEAFDKACPHDTPRQIQAYVQAKRSLKIKSAPEDG
jgi:CRISPR system Cascade subunit CasA